MPLPAIPFVASLLGGLVTIAGTVAGRVLLSLGFSIVSYTGASFTLGWLKDQAVSSLTGMPGQVVQLMAYMKVGEAISMVFSAILARYLIDSLGSGVLKRLVMR